MNRNMKSLLQHIANRRAVILVTTCLLMRTVAVWAGALIHEPFRMAEGALAGQAGGTGLGTWTTAGTSGIVTNQSPAFGSLHAAGNQYTGRGHNWAPCTTTLSSAGLLSDGAVLWFSVILQPKIDANSYAFMGLSSSDAGAVSVNFETVPAGANVWGIWLQNGHDLEMACATNGVTTGGRVIVQQNLSLVNPTLVVGKFTWGADSGAVDTLQVYLPAVDLVLPATHKAIQSKVIDQSTFAYLGINIFHAGSLLDEIRFGATYEDVTPLPPPRGTVIILK